jgi:hypothetical protein
VTTVSGIHYIWFSIIVLLTLRLPNSIPSVIRVSSAAGKVFTHNCATGKLSALIQCGNIVQQIERDGFQRCKNVGPYIYDVKISGFTRGSIYIRH